MDYKKLFEQVLALISMPAKAWDAIAEQNKGREIMTAFVYPLIGLCGLSEFIGTFLGRDLSVMMFQIALTRCCAVAVALFGGFFLAIYLLNRITARMFGWGSQYERIQVFVGYSMTVTFVLNIISGLVSIVLLHWILQLYTMVLVFEGAKRWLKVPETKLTSFSVVATLCILISPAVIEFVFNKLSVILN